MKFGSVPVLSVVVLLILSTGWKAEAAVSCSTSDYIGTYAFYASGYFLQLPSSAASLTGRFAQAGTFTSDGKGIAKIQSTASYNGQIQSFDATATYTINSDCTLAFQLTLPPPLNQPATLQAVLSQNNGQMSAMITDPPGSTIVSTHIKQYIQYCKTSDLNGAYVIDLEGSNPAVGPNPAGPFRRAGRLIADGAGKFTSNSLANYSGQLVREIIDGTYTVDSGCNVKLSYSYGTGGSTPIGISMSGALSGAGYDAMIIVTTPGWTASGTLKSVQ